MIRFSGPEAPGWPARLEPSAATAPDVVLRALIRRDEAAWFDVRVANAEHLRPWDPTPPTPPGPRPTFAQYVRSLTTEAAAGRALPFAIEHAGAVVGQMHLFGIARASELSGSAGYWVSQAVGGRGIATWALAMLIDHAFEPAGLHRVEVNVRPENTVSQAVVSRLGLREEGFRKRFLHIDGQWRDHRSFAITAEELSGQSMQSRLAAHPRWADGTS